MMKKKYIHKNKLTKEIFEGEKEAKIEIILKNNNKKVWPKNSTVLTYDFNSNFIQDDIILEPQEYNEIKKYDIIINGLANYPVKKYKIYLLFKVNGDNFGEKIEITLIIKERNNEDLIKVNQFREAFNLDKEEYSDEEILKLLKQYNYNFEKVFSLLFD